MLRFRVNVWILAPYKNKAKLPGNICLLRQSLPIKAAIFASFCLCYGPFLGFSLCEILGTPCAM